MMGVPPRAPLEDWLRDYYFTNQIDISSSGVQPYAMSDLYAMVGLPPGVLDDLVLRDSHSRGGPELRTAVAEAFGDGREERVMVTNGSCEAIYLFMTTFLRPGDEVIVQAPAYHMLNTLPASLGCAVVLWPLRAENGFRPDLDELRSLVSARTRAVIVNFPHNPTGASLDRAGQAELVRIAERAGAYLVWDQAFRELVYDDDHLLDALVPYERFVAFNTLSKSYGLPGLRVGWAIMPPELIDPCVGLRDYVSYSLSPLVERVALYAVRGANRLLAVRRDQVRANLERLRQWLSEQGDMVDCPVPMGGVSAFPRLTSVRDVDAFCQHLMDDYGVLLVPGSCFGMPQHVRLGFGGPSADLADGLDRVAALLRASCATTG
jgi:capreomycidine synthase